MKNDYWVSQAIDGKWRVTEEGAAYPIATFGTQGQAWGHALTLARAMRSEAFLKDRNGHIRERNTFRTDPHPPRG